MGKVNPVGVLLTVALLLVLIAFGVIAWRQYDLAWQIYQDNKDLENAAERFEAMMSSFDKTLTTLVGFVTAVATGILGYFGGSAGKQEAQDQAAQAKGALTEAVSEAGNAQFIANLESKYPKAFGK